MFLNVLFLFCIPFLLAPGKEAAPPSVTEEVSFFDVILKDKVVGELKAVKTDDGSTVTYLSQTNIQTRLIFKIHVDYVTKVVFKDGVMQEAKADIIVNGKNWTDTHTKLENGTYRFFKDGKQEKTLSESISYSSIQLLFKEPVGIDAAYSEESGGFYTIRDKGESFYEKVNSRGRKTTYKYQNRVLENINLDAGIVEFEMINKEN